MSRPASPPGRAKLASGYKPQFRRLSTSLGVVRCAVLQHRAPSLRVGAPGRTRTCDLPLSSGARVPVCATGAWGRDSFTRVTAPSFSLGNSQERF